MSAGQNGHPYARPAFRAVRFASTRSDVSPQTFTRKLDHSYSPGLATIPARTGLSSMYRMHVGG